MRARMNLSAILTCLSSLLFASSCLASPAASAKSLPKESVEERASDSCFFYREGQEKRLLCAFTKADGGTRRFYQVRDTVQGIPYQLYCVDEDNGLVKRIRTPYVRYADDGFDCFEEGAPHYKYLLSPDRSKLYLVTTVLANGSGWMNDYQLFIVDCEKASATFVDACAGIQVTSTGFELAKARITNEEEALCTVDYEYAIHDVCLDWDGKVTHDGKDKEYGYKKFTRKYHQKDDDSFLPYVKGYLR